MRAAGVALLCLCTGWCAGLDFLIDDSAVAGGICAKPTVGAAPCTVPVSAVGELRRLLRTDRMGGELAVGRSYDGHAWEGLNPEPAVFTCTNDAECTFEWAPARYEYRVERVGVTEPAGKKHATAKLLTQATFGAKKALIDGFEAAGGGDAAAAGRWFDTQVGSQLLIREYLRRRTNPRINADEDWPVYGECDVGSRWHNHAFILRDRGLELTVAEAGGVKTLTLEGGVAATQVPSGDITASPGKYYICDLKEAVGGALVLHRNKACPKANRVEESHPAIAFTDPAAVGVTAWNLKGDDSVAELKPLAARDGVVIVQKVKGACQPRRFIKNGGAYYRYDRRMKFLTNTLASPTTGHAYEVMNKGPRCPAVGLNIVNEATCPLTLISPCDGGSVSCGSRGEVANDPNLGAMFASIHHPGADAVTLRRDERDAVYGLASDQKLSMFHNPAVFDDDNQLRLRTAWAFYQILPISEDIGDETQVEFWAAYLDIFMANAFGNYRDVLREVSYSAQMGKYLSFKDNRAYSYAATLPDQNFAREIMQLFTIGLSMMKRDGSMDYDAPTYDTFDIITFSRAWTGFVGGGLRRANTEWLSMYTILDPMRIQGDQRDAFPKMDTRDGYIGDGYPLCADLPTQPFLMTGAAYEYHGTAPAYEPGYAARPTSAAKEDWGAAFTLDGAASAPNGKTFLRASVAAAPAPEKAAWAPLELWVVGSNGAKLRIKSVRPLKAAKLFEWAPMPTGKTLAEEAAAFSQTFPSGVALTLRNHEGDDAPARLAQFAPAPGSPLHSFLCGGADPCEPKARRVLDAPLGCGGDAVCAKLADPTVVAVASGGATHYFSYVSAPCVKMALFEQGRTLTEKMYRNELGMKRAQCGDPRLPIGGAACCAPDGTAVEYYAPKQCAVLGERMPLAVAEARCAAEGLTLCPPADAIDFSFDETCAARQPTWTSTPCALKIHVQDGGQINLMDGMTHDQRLQPATPNAFLPQWENEEYPTPASVDGGASTCVKANDGVECDVAIKSEAVFSELPSRGHADAQLKIGAVHPSEYGSGVYACASGGGCDADDVVMFTKDGAVDDETIIGLKVPATRGGGYRYYMNHKQNVVVGGVYVFRNAPTFMRLAGEASPPKEGNVFYKDAYGPWLLAASRAAAHETEAVLDHLFYHQNTAPFLAKLFIQRFVTSNPSPRYIETVATAFVEGTHGSRGSGRYGCMKAMLAAVLLDREARSATLDADPGHGVAREPFLKVLQVLRSQELSMEPHVLRLSLANVGQDVMQSPSIFGFYLPSFVPSGPLETARLVSPENQLAVTPLVFTLLNGLQSIVKTNGIAPGAAFMQVAASVPQGQFMLDPVGNHPSVSAGTYPDAAIISDALDELDLTLCDGRLSPASRSIITAAVPAYPSGPLADKTKDPYACPKGYTLEANCDTCTGGSTCAAADRCVSDTDPADIVPPPRTCRKRSNGKLVMRGSNEPCCYAPDAAHAQVTIRNSLRGLMLLAPEFHTTNLARPAAGTRPPVVPSGATGTSGYKAVVAYNMQGGADSFNHVIPGPAGKCTVGDVSYDSYKERRGVVALNETDLVSIAPRNGHAQPCSEFYLHPDLTEVAQLFADGDAAVFANVGNLIHPFTAATKAQAEVPAYRGAHNFGQQHAQNMHCQAGTAAKGILGRMADQVTASGGVAALYGIDAVPLMLRSESATPTIVDLNEGAQVLAIAAEHGDAVQQLLGTKAKSHFAETYLAGTHLSMSVSVDLRAKLDAAVTDAPATATFEDDRVSKQFDLIATIMRLRNSDKTRLADRDFFMAKGGGYDTHDVASERSTKAFNLAMKSFKEELVAQQVWADTVVVTMSEFGRTFTSNGKGTDHAWGGNYFAMGGSIIDQTMLGTFPSSVEKGNDYDWGNGVFIPSWGFEVYWGPIADWIGIDAAHWGTVLPNLERFPATCKHHLFEVAGGAEECATRPPTPAPPTPPPTPAPAAVPEVPLGPYTELCPYVDFPAAAPLTSLKYSLGTCDGQAAVKLRAEMPVGKWGAVGLRAKPGHAMEGLDIVAWDTTGALRDYEESVGPLGPEEAGYTFTALAASADAGGTHVAEFYRLLYNRVDFTIALDQQLNLAVAVGDGTIDGYWQKHAQRAAQNHAFAACDALTEWLTVNPPTPQPPIPTPSPPVPPGATPSPVPVVTPSPAGSTASLDAGSVSVSVRGSETASDDVSVSGSGDGGGVGGGEPTPAPENLQLNNGANEREGDEDEFPWWVLVVVGVALLLAGVAALVVQRRRRANTAEFEEVNQAPPVDMTELESRPGMLDTARPAATQLSLLSHECPGPARSGAGSEYGGRSDVPSLAAESPKVAASFGGDDPLGIATPPRLAKATASNPPSFNLI